jgi:hypothetical protein
MKKHLMKVIKLILKKGKNECSKIVYKKKGYALIEHL